MQSFVFSSPGGSLVPLFYIFLRIWSYFSIILTPSCIIFISLSTWHPRGQDDATDAVVYMALFLYMRMIDFLCFKIKKSPHSFIRERLYVCLSVRQYVYYTFYWWALWLVEYGFLKVFEYLHPTNVTSENLSQYLILYAPDVIKTILILKLDQKVRPFIFHLL